MIITYVISLLIDGARSQSAIDPPRSSFHNGWRFHPMLFRYAKTDDGTAVRQAVIYTADEHSIVRDSIDEDALRVTRRLRSSGHVAYIVGGAVRDLMLGKRPKDFDIATDAQPNRIRRLFRNSRVIGKRFRLVHVIFKDKVIEVSTFRSAQSLGFQNDYGDIEEDSRRRDFTLNALYYSPDDGQILDYVGGVRDVRARTVRPVIPIDRIFVEDPVRMVRAVKYAVSTGFRLSNKLRRGIKKEADLLEQISPSRITEEVFKILLSGNASKTIQELIKFDLLKDMLPELNRLLTSGPKEYQTVFFDRLSDLDAEVEEGDEDRRSRGLAYLLADYLYTQSPFAAEERIPFKEAFSDLKAFIRPLVPANKDVEMALVYLIRRRKNYRKGGKLETAPPAERIDQREAERVEVEEHRRERSPVPAPGKRRRRRPRRKRGGAASPDKPGSPNGGSPPSDAS
jgi:poly(A) polymerase